MAIVYAGRSWSLDFNLSVIAVPVRGRTVNAPTMIHLTQMLMEYWHVHVSEDMEGAVDVV